MAEPDLLPAPSPAPRGPVAAAAPLLFGYWTFGQYWGVWVVIFADFLREHGISAGELGLLFSGLTVVSLVTMVWVAPRLQPIPLRGSCALALSVMAVGALLLGLLPTALLLVPFVVLGVGNGLIDVFLNVSAQALEVRTRRPILQWLHASYSVGGITGALAAGVAHTAGVGFPASLTGAALLLFVSAAWTSNAAPDADRSGEPPDRVRASLSIFVRAPFLLVPAGALLCAFLVEGSMDTWSVIYLRETLGASTFSGAVAFAAFAAAMAAGRLFAGRMLFGLGYRRTILLSGFGSFAAALTATFTDRPAIAGIAFLVLGFALSSTAPAAFGLVEETDADPAHTIAAMTTIGYSGFLFGPPLMGWLADGVSLRATMGVIVAATVGVLAAGLAAPRRRPVSPRG